MSRSCVPERKSCIGMRSGIEEHESTPCHILEIDTINHMEQPSKASIEQVLAQKHTDECDKCDFSIEKGQILPKKNPNVVVSKEHPQGGTQVRTCPLTRPKTKPRSEVKANQR